MTARVDLIAQTLARHAVRRVGRSYCLCGWRSATEAHEAHQAREVDAALTADAARRRTGRVQGDCEHGAPFGGQRCVECHQGVAIP